MHLSLSVKLFLGMVHKAEGVWPKNPGKVNHPHPASPIEGEEFEIKGKRCVIKGEEGCEIKTTTERTFQGGAR